MRRNSALPQHLIRTRETTILRTQCASYSRRHITPNCPAVTPHSSAIRPEAQPFQTCFQIVLQKLEGRNPLATYPNDARAFH